MKRVLFVMACLVIPSLALSAPADSTSTPPTRSNSLRAGAWALQFDINGQLLSIESFAGGLSLKRHFSPKSALRIGVGVSASSTDLNTETSFAREVNENSSGTFFEVMYQRYANPGAEVNAYWGIGPRVSYARSTRESDTGSVTSREELTHWAVGAIAALGAEWFATRQFSFHGEFTARGNYLSEEITSENKPDGQPATTFSSENKGWEATISSSIRLGMSVYF